MAETAETAQKNKVAAVVQKESSTPTGRGAGPADTVATATETLTKAAVVTPPAINSGATHVGLGTAQPATAANFDRTVATTLGK